MARGEPREPGFDHGLDREMATAGRGQIAAEALELTREVLASRVEEIQKGAFRELDDGTMTPDSGLQRWAQLREVAHLLASLGTMLKKGSKAQKRAAPKLTRVGPAA